jgi:2-phosphosulfolactate phosphatase
MVIDVHFTPLQVDEFSLRDRTIVVIDVLRAGTSIIVALSNGAKEIIPVATVESAVKISGNLFGDVILLGGERNGKMIEGFNLGNSPSEYTQDRVRGKSIIFNTTNGSQALVKARYARELFVCGFVNISAAAKILAENPRDFTVLCSGNNGAFSMEDSVCAGMLIDKVTTLGDTKFALTDGSQAAHALYKKFGKNILKVVGTSDHGRHLREIGFDADLKTCAGIDTIPVVGCLDGNSIKLRREPEAKEVPLVPVTP